MADSTDTAVSGDFAIDADVLAEGFGLSAEDFRERLRAGAVTGRVYRGIDEDAGTWRLEAFHANARLTVITDEEGRPLRRSLVDFGDRPLPREMRLPPDGGISRSTARRA
ncbi:DUF6522 family protein [Stappia sp. 28M-7]|uniref:DUF6522 family protein n=1 Tax=Stappia sp. 28M-7 TaxID=2762596 RepID=UPI00163C721E|nr:DUF6522 family protein [Stappia sp. 28M-7]MBC2859643.1 hypothetical protein [Stappia sp. 28M-7]